MSGAHGHAGGRHRWRLAVAFVLIASFFVVELVAGLLAQSLALLSDAGHMAADVVTLGVALFATRIETRVDRTGGRTFGSYRAEIFALGFAVLFMMGMSVYIGTEAVRRLGETTNPAAGTMLVVGGLGLIVNLIALVMLRGGAGESLNVKGAYLEVVAETLGSVGVIAAALLVQWTGGGWWDTLVALAIAVFVFVRAIFLAREVLTVLGQHAPRGIEPEDLVQALEQVPGVVAVHDLHVWTLTSGMDVATAHLVATGDSQEVLNRAAQVLQDRFNIAHATLQIEDENATSYQGATL